MLRALDYRFGAGAGLRAAKHLNTSVEKQTVDERKKEEQGVLDDCCGRKN